MSTDIIPQYEQLSYMNPLWWSLWEKCPYLELSWSVFSLIRTEYGEIQSISPYSVQMRENVDQNNSEYGHFSRSDHFYTVNDVDCEKVDVKNLFFVMIKKRTSKWKTTK